MIYSMDSASASVFQSRSYDADLETQYKCCNLARDAVNVEVDEQDEALDVTNMGVEIFGRSRCVVWCVCPHIL